MRRTRGNAIPPSGAFIYAYCNVRTNQVLYSLERTLKPSHLKQLPDVGANNTPPTLRKDVWRPLFTVALMQDETGQEQSRYMFQKLREYRKLHETCWKASPLLSRSYTQTEIDEMKGELDKRGGAKKETVYDIIKRRKWKMRVKTVMDQKANSIADLAAVLLEQDDAGERAAERNRTAQGRYQQIVAEEMLSLAKKAEGGAIEQRERNLVELRGQLETAESREKQRLTTKIEDYDLRIKMMKFATEAVANARTTARDQLATSVGQTDAPEANKVEQNAQPGTSESNSNLATYPTEDALVKTLLPPWPTEIDPHTIAASRNRQEHRFRRGPNNLENLRFNRPIYSTDGITVSWANILDAEYAQLWPLAVQHRRMGLARHVAPIPLESAQNAWQRAGQPEGEEHIGVAEDVLTLKQTQVSKRSRDFAARRARQAVLDELKTQIVESVASKEAQGTATSQSAVIADATGSVGRVPRAEVGA